jgi:hypothetical protein
LKNAEPAAIANSPVPDKDVLITLRVMIVHRNLKNLADFQAIVCRHHAERDEY